MNKISITIEGSIEEMRTVLYSLSSLGLLGMDKAPVSSMETPVTRIDEESRLWTEGSVRIVWQFLTYKAQEVLKEIWKKPDGYPWDKLQQELGMTPNAIGGCLSSLGHQIRINGYQNYPNPLQYVIASGVLAKKLHPIWQETISKLIEEEGKNG